MDHSPLKYATVCSGIEAPSSAWHSLGWEPVWFSEIEPFPCKVLKHHYPQVPNLGDMTKLNEHEIYRESTIDLFCGGTPCQSFSIAGLRGGLDDERGNLALEYCRILIAKRPRWFVWENVPGVFSSNGGKDFACILSAFTGKEINAEGLGNAGVIEGEFYSVAWRVLDAQYFGVPQRRRRVFVVGYLGEDWRPPFAVLFERDSLRRDFEASAKERKGTTGKAEGDINSASWWDGGDTASTLTKHNANGAQRMPDKDNFGALLQSCPYQKNVSMDGFNFEMYSGECKEVSPCLQKDRAKDTLVYPSHGAGPCAKQTTIAVIESNGTFYVGSNWCNTPQQTCPRKDLPSGVGYELCKSVCNQNAHAEVDACQKAGKNANGGTLYLVGHTYCCDNCKSVMAAYGIKDVVIGKLPEGFSFEAPTKHGTLCIQGSMLGREDKNGPQGSGLNDEVSFTLNKTDKHAVVYDTTQITSPQNGSNPQPELCHSLAKGQHVPLVTLPEVVACEQADTITIGANQTTGRPGDIAAINAIARRLTPLECERLQGFPDNHTAIPGAKDGPRYAAIGNSMAVPVMKWIGERIAMMDKIMKELKSPTP